jgi:tetratricopeptide (TPR) repeat protein
MRKHHRLSKATLAVLLAVVVGVVACGGAAEDVPEPWETAGRAAEQSYRAELMAQAESGFREALRLATLADSDVGRMNSLEGLAASNAASGKLDEADSLYSVLLDLQRQRLAADSLSGMAMVRTLGSLGQINLSRGEISRSDSFFTRIMDLHSKGEVDLRAEEPALAYALRGLGEVLAARGQTAAADSLRARALGLRLYGQGFSLFVGDDMVRAEEIWRRALAHQDSVLGTHHTDVAQTAHALGQLLELVGRQDEAISQYERATQIYSALGTTPIQQARTLDHLGGVLQSSNPAAANSLHRRANEIRNRMTP